MKTGLTASTEGRMIFGPGEIFINFDEEYLTGTSLGATRGGSEFNPGRSQRVIPVDGVKGRIKGLTKIDNVEPTLKVRLLEITADNLQAAIAGATTDDDGNIIGGEIGEATYLDSVALVAEDTSGNDFIVIIYNALATEIAPVSLPDKGEAILEVTFTGHFDPSTPEEEPWKIIPVAVGS